MPPAASSSSSSSFSSSYSSINGEFRTRSSVLVSLMIVQSLSGIILSRFDDLIKDHIIVTLFLTMLVGAGGNAGNQVSVLRFTTFFSKPNASRFSASLVLSGKLTLQTHYVDTGNREHNPDFSLAKGR